MTGRTHDLAAFTALSLVVISQPIPEMRLSTLVVAFTANFVGGLAPDLDQPTGNLWHRLPVGSYFGKLLSPLLGGHRFISHSIVGLALFGFGLHYLLNLASSVLLVNMNIVWWAFLIGYFSHLIMDTLTTEGVPWLFPIPWKIGFPPFKFLRIKTGGLIEKFVVFPALLIFNGYLLYTHYNQILSFLHHYIK
jgi:inner membrane protein